MLEVIAQVAAVGLAAWAAWLSVPRPPQLDWRRLLEATLSVIQSGQPPAEAEGDDASFQPVGAIGIGADWSAIASWSEAVTAGLRRKHGHVVVVGVQTGLAEAMVEVIGGRGGTLSAERLMEGLEALVEAPSDRLVLLGAGEGLPVILRAMHEHPGLRDRVLAVISLGGNINRSETQRAWMAEHFTQTAMDTELNRPTAYFSIALEDEEEPTDTDWEGQRWPAPKPDRTGRTPIHPIDLGPLPREWLSVRREGLARALWVVLSFWL